MKIPPRIIPTLGVLVCLYLGCIKPLEIPLEEPAQLLVVNGLMTDQPGPYEVILSWSSLTTEPDFEPVSGASLRIEAENGSFHDLTMQGLGRYVTDSADFRGVVDESYRLHIGLSDGRSYASDWMTLKRSPAIDSVYHKVEEKFTPERTLKGIGIYLDTHDPENNTRFYRWKWVETWKYQVPLPAQFEYLGNNQVRLLENISTCWNTDYSSQILIGSSVGNQADVIAGFPLYFVSTGTNRLQLHYSVLVQQYALSESEFLFWKSLKESNEGVGTLFDKQPQSTTGNVHNVDDPQEPVLGYFSASGVSEMRFFVRRFILPGGFSVDPSAFPICMASLDTIPIGPGADDLVFERIRQGKVFYKFDGDFSITGYILTTPFCADCRVQGGTTTKPDFWVD